MDWTIKLEARSGWGEVETIGVARLERRVVGLTAEEVGLACRGLRRYWRYFSGSCSRPRWKNTWWLLSGSGVVILVVPLASI